MMGMSGNSNGFLLANVLPARVLLVHVLLIHVLLASERKCLSMAASGWTP